jgi:hypothetical protein
MPVIFDGGKSGVMPGPNRCQDLTISLKAERVLLVKRRAENLFINKKQKRQRPLIFNTQNIRGLMSCRLLDKTHQN